MFAVHLLYALALLLLGGWLAFALAGAGGGAVAVFLGAAAVCAGAAVLLRRGLRGPEMLPLAGNPAERILQQIPDGLVIVDARGRIEAVNPAFETVTGYRRSKLIGRSVRLLRSPRHARSFYRHIRSEVRRRGRWQGEIWIRRGDGEVHPEWLSLTALRDGAGTVTRYVGMFSDLASHRKVKERLHRLAYYDVLTDLPNRQLFRDRLATTLVEARRSNHGVAVMFVDLDHFKHINDTLGHRTGDRILQAVAARIRNAVRVTDTIARIGGDEFTVIVPDLPGPATAAAVARKILTLLEHPFGFEGREFFISASIGIALCPQDGEHPDALIRHADIAMYRAKELGRNNYQMYTEELSRRFQRRVALENELRRGVDRGQLHLVYQPLVELGSGQLVGLEALARWEHPHFGSVPPATFIEIAEQTDLIDRIGEWVLRTACREAREWGDPWPQGLRLAVNVSARQLHRGDFAERVARALAETGMAPSSLALELTETVMAEPHSSLHQSTLRALSEMGVQITIDDFGTGYSSLSYLKRFAVDKVKIDRSFTRDLPGDANDRALASMIIAMAHATNMRVTAEGVETEQQLQFLRDQGCDEVQGFLIARPVAAAGVAELCLQKNRGPNPAVLPRDPTPEGLTF